MYLALAQLRAAQAAEASTKAHPPVSAAIGGASVAVLSNFFPLDVAEIEAALDAQEAANADDARAAGASVSRRPTTVCRISRS